MANLGNLFLAASIDMTIFIIAIVGVLIIALGAGLFVGRLINKKSTEKKLGDVESRAEKMISDATAECKALKRDAILEAKKQLPRKPMWEREMSE